MLALLLVALSLGPSNFAATIGIGVTGVDAGARLRVDLIFGIFEAGMPILVCCSATAWPTCWAVPPTESAPRC